MRYKYIYTYDAATKKEGPLGFFAIYIYIDVDGVRRAGIGEAASGGGCF